MLNTLLRTRAPGAALRENRQLKRDLEHAQRELHWTREHLRDAVAVLHAIHDMARDNVDRPNAPRCVCFSPADIAARRLPDRIQERVMRTLCLFTPKELQPPRIR